MPVPGFLIDIRPILMAFDPLRSQSHYYVTYPRLRQVVANITLQRIIECVFVIPAHDLQENGLTSVLYEYIEHQCTAAMELFEADADLIFNFDLLVNDITEVMDIHLKQSTAIYTNQYDQYVFDHWAAENLAAFVRLNHET